MGIKDWFGRFRKRKAVPAEEIIEETTVEETVAGSEDPATAFGASETDGSYGEESFDAEPAETAEVFEADEIIAAEPLPRLTDVDFEGFWHDTRESERRHVSAAPDYRIIRDVEQELGYKLPASYIELMKQHNGGLVNRGWFPIRPDAHDFGDFIQITDILGIGRETPYSLCGRFGSRYLTEGWRHNADIGVAICNTIKPGRALVFLDYRKCGVNGEPEVLYSDVDTGEEKTIARDFESFLRGLCDGHFE